MAQRDQSPDQVIQLAQEDGAPSVRMPVGFVGHGAPLAALDSGGAPAAWQKWGASMPRPRALAVVSAHWLERPPHVGPAQRVPLIYDFYGFPEQLYRMQYPAPGAEALATQVLSLLSQAGQAGLKPVSAPTRGLDHGAWMQLYHMFPQADIPVLQVSLGTGVSMSEHVALGRALAPLREQGVLILGSGNIVHNLRRADLRAKHGPVDSWAQEFDDWCAQALERGDLDALADYAQRAPAAELAVPTDDHFTPLVVAAAAAFATSTAAVRYPHIGFEYRNLSMRCVEFR
jgi:4,5-DOPA dioxygenase extradiol